MANVVIAQSIDGDWQGLYINNKLVFQNDFIGPEDLLKNILNVTVENAYFIVFDNSELPDKYTDIKPASDLIPLKYR